MNTRESKRKITHDFKGKVALVAGGAAGIGRAIAIAFARQEVSMVFVGKYQRRDNGPKSSTRR